MPEKETRQRTLLTILSPSTVLALFVTVVIALYFPEVSRTIASNGLHHAIITTLLILTASWAVFWFKNLQVTNTSPHTSKNEEISTQTKTEQALKESEERFKLLVEKAPIGIITFDTMGQIVDVNSKMVEIFGSPSADQTRRINVLEYSQMVEMGLSGDLGECLINGKSGVYERAYVSKWGKSVYLRYNTTPLRDLNDQIVGAMAIMEDFSDRKEAELELLNLNAQIKKETETKAVLLKEVNHRVKNNLAGIIGLLYATRKFVNKVSSKEEYLSTLENLIHRIEGMATVHEILTEADWSALPISELTSRILSNSLRALPIDKRITSDITTDDDVLISPKQASNLGMVINELITNTIKHALAEQNSAKITVRISKEGNEVLFQYHNDGPEFTEDVLTLKQVNTGMYLTETIVKNGLGGTLTLQNDNGALTLIRFKP